MTGHRGGGAAFAAAHQRMQQDGRFQFDFPAYVQPEPPAWLVWLGRLLRPLAPLTPYLFWGALIGIAGWILVLGGRELLRSDGAAAGRAKVLDMGGIAPSPRRVQALLEECDRLAAEGRFGEAVRILLLRTLDDIEARRPGLIGTALTAREIATLPALPIDARRPLSKIAGAVERFVFAGRGIDARTFQDCRADYDRFLAAAAATGVRA